MNTTSAESNHEESPLQSSLIEIKEILNANYPNYVSTLDFLQAGVISPSAGISRLKMRGAIIETETKTIADRSGRTRKGIACYRLMGWL